VGVDALEFAVELRSGLRGEADMDGIGGGVLGGGDLGDFEEFEDFGAWLADGEREGPFAELEEVELFAGADNALADFEFTGVVAVEEDAVFEQVLDSLVLGEVVLDALEESDAESGVSVAEELVDGHARAAGRVLRDQIGLMKGYIGREGAKILTDVVKGIEDVIDAGVLLQAGEGEDLGEQDYESY